MGHSESSAEREIPSIAGLSQETRIISNKQSNLTFKGTRIRITNKAQSEQKKGNNKDQRRNKESKKIQKINETKRWFFETINKIDKPLTRLIKKKRERTQINKIRNQREISADSTETRGFLKILQIQYANKLENLDETDKVLETYNLPKLNQEESENLYRQITTNYSEAVI